MGKDYKGRELGKGLSQQCNGMYLARTSLNGVRTQKSFKTLADAQRWLKDAKNGNDGLTVSKWYDEWIDTYKRGKVKDSTITTYTYHYLRYIDSVIGRMLISEVKPIHCQRVLNESAKNTDSYKSVSQVRTLLVGMFKCAVANDLIDKNPVNELVKCPTMKKHEADVLSADEQRKLVENLADCVFRPQILVMMNTGMRVGELTALTVSDLNFDKRIINVTKSMTYVDGAWKVTSPKTDNSIRVIPMNDIVYDILKQKSCGLNANDYLFTTKNGKPIIRHNYNVALRRTCRLIGIRDISCHTLRHTFATRCIEAGMQPKILQKILGHSNINITMNLYVHATDDEITRQMKMVGNIAT